MRRLERSSVERRRLRLAIAVFGAGLFLGAGLAGCGSAQRPSRGTQQAEPPSPPPPASKPAPPPAPPPPIFPPRRDEGPSDDQARRQRAPSPKPGEHPTPSAEPGRPPPSAPSAGRAEPARPPSDVRPEAKTEAPSGLERKPAEERPPPSAPEEEKAKAPALGESGPPTPPTPPTPTAPGAKPAAAAPVKKPAEYERILGTFTIDPELFIYLTPEICSRAFDGRLEDRGFLALVSALEAAGARRGEAAARLNWGAVLWSLGRIEPAYAQVMRAQALFAELGDVDGLAHAYEWIGWFMKESRDLAKAGEHWSVAYRMFTILDDSAAAERILRYAAR